MEPTPAPQHPQSSHSRSTLGRKILLYLITALLLVGGIWFAWSNRTYADSSQSGYVLKMSKEGIIFRTLEGELTIGMSPGAYAANPRSSIWRFSIKKKHKAVYDQLQSLQGQKVAVSYKEKIRTFPWQGKTKYFVYDVRKIE